METISAVSISALEAKATIPLGTEYPCSGGWMRAQMVFPSGYTPLPRCTHL